MNRHSGGEPSRVRSAPSQNHDAWGLPLLKGNRPDSRTAPSPAGSARPIGPKRPAMPEPGSRSRISRATAGSSQQLKNDVLRIIDVHPVEPSARDSSSMTAHTVSGVDLGSTQRPRNEHTEHSGAADPRDEVIRDRSARLGLGGACRHFVGQQAHRFERRHRRRLRRRPHGYGGTTDTEEDGEWLHRVRGCTSPRIASRTR